MAVPERYHYREAHNTVGETLPRPLLPLTLGNEERSTTQLGLLDTGATVNVLPYEIGITLGLSWGSQTQAVALAGNLGQHEARAVVLIGQVGQFDPVPLIFAWTRMVNAPLLLGQVNFSRSSMCAFSGRKQRSRSVRKGESELNINQE